MPDFRNINVAELEAMMQQGEVLLVDVRTDAEAARGRIPRGISVPLHLFPARLGELDKARPTVFYCQMGGRSAQAAAFAAASGFAGAYNLQGGISAWMQAGLAVEA